jgi:hypothetical protein
VGDRSLQPPAAAAAGSIIWDTPPGHQPHGGAALLPAPPRPWICCPLKSTSRQWGGWQTRGSTPRAWILRCSPARPSSPSRWPSASPSTYPAHLQLGQPRPRLLRHRQQGQPPGLDHAGITHGLALASSCATQGVLMLVPQCSSSPISRLLPLLPAPPPQSSDRLVVITNDAQDHS